MKPMRCIWGLGLAMILGSVACSDGAECGPGTSENNGNCVLSCGEGTVEANGECVSLCEDTSETPDPDSNGCVAATQIQLVHASADPDLATVDVYVGMNLLETEDGEVVGDDLAFRSATPIVKVATNLPIRVTASDSASSEDFLFEVPASELSASSGFLFVVRPTADGASAELVAFEGLLPSGVGSTTRFSFVNASVGGSLSVGRQESYGVAASEELFSNVAGDMPSGEPLPTVIAPPGTTAFDIYEAGGGLPLASVQTSSGDVIPAVSGLAEGDTGVLVALGVQEPEGGQPALDFLWVLADGRVGPADRAARLQLVHGSFEAGTGVDVYLSASEDSEFGEPIAADLLYQQATPFQSFVAGVPGVVRLVGNTSEPTPENVVSSTPVDFGFGQTARVVALGGSADSPLTVNVVEGSEQAADPATIDIQLYHTSTTAPSPVDVYFFSAALGVPNIDFANPDVAGLTFGVPPLALQGQAFETIFIALSADGASVAVFFIAPVEGLWFPDGLGQSFFAVVNGSAESSPADLDFTMFSPAGGLGEQTDSGSR